MKYIVDQNMININDLPKEVKIIMWEKLIKEFKKNQSKPVENIKNTYTKEQLEEAYKTRPFLLEC